MSVPDNRLPTTDAAATDVATVELELSTGGLTTVTGSDTAFAFPLALTVALDAFIGNAIP